MSGNFLERDHEQYHEQIFKEFGKTKEVIDEYIDIMKKWAETQPHFPEKPSERILRFVIVYNKFSIEKAKQKLDMFYTIRNLLPDFFEKTPFTPDMILQHKVWFVVPLPKITKDYGRIIFNRLNPEYDDPKYTIHDQFAIQFIQLMHYLIEADLCYRFHYVADCSGLKLGHGTKISPMVLSKWSLVLEKVFSNRISSMILVNMPPFLEAFINNIVKPALHPKLRERFKVYSESQVLVDIFGKERLPKDVGGEEKSLKELSELLMQDYKENHKERFQKLSKMKTDESLRPVKLKNDEILGYYGNFKKLNVD